MLGEIRVYFLVTIPAQVFGWDFPPSYGHNINDYTLHDPICEGPAIHTFFCDDQNFPYLSVATVSYGRTDTTTCPYKGDVQSTANQNTNCAASEAAVKKTVYDNCNNKARCDVTASNDFFEGDPCPNTYKYLTIRVMCKQITS